MNILFLTFYFEPDLCAGSFRNTALVKTLATELTDEDRIDVITTYPNRYKTYKKGAQNFEENGKVRIYRVNVPEHKSGFADQINTFKSFFFGTKNIIRNKKYDLVFASSARLFTAYLGYTIARKKEIPLYLDIRDIFADAMGDILKHSFIKTVALPIIKYIEKKTFDYAAHINLVSGGFRPYFSNFKCNTYSEFSNGIDDEFLDIPLSESKGIDKKTSILYAGNIGEGQGLEKIIPRAASLLGNDYHFIVVGDGGTKDKLLQEISERKLSNVELRNPVDRVELKRLYYESDYLFLHLNYYKAFEKVLPSKIFEFAAYDKPIIAGVSGFSYHFIKENISNVILFKPCDVDDLMEQLKTYTYRTESRRDFINRFRREIINKNMAQSILKYRKGIRG
ncbi:glycosyltransferase WbuB [Spirochaetia bacterium]|nr:glycosyltransferase WbuB [Spirochaetia bacterium]